MKPYAESIVSDHQPLVLDGVPHVGASEARIAADAPTALAYLRRRGALDLADMLGIGGAA